MFRNALRILILSVTLTGGCVLLAQTNDPLVNYTCQGIQCRYVLEEFSRRYDVRLAASSMMGAEPLILKVSGQPLSKLLEKIAIVTGGEWQLETDGTKRLIAKKKPAGEPKPSPETIERIRKAQAKSREELSKTKPFDREAANDLIVELEEFMRAETSDQQFFRRGEAIGQKGPMSLLAQRIFVELDPKILASVERSNRVVFSTQPNRSQLKLPQACLPKLAQFAKEYDAWKSALGNKTFKYPNRGLPSSIHYLIQGSFEWDEPRPDESQNLSKALVFASAWSGEGASNIEVNIVNEKGRYVASASEPIPQMLGSEGTNDLQKITESPADPNEPEFQLSTESTEYVMRISAAFSDSSRQESVGISSSLEKRMLAPEQFDPISLVIPEMLIQYANFKKINLVACPPDFATLIAAFAQVQGHSKTGKVIDLLKSAQVGAQISIDDEYLLFSNQATSPSLPKSMKTRLDRSVLGTTTRAIKKLGFMSIELKSESAYRAGDDEQGDFLMANFVGALYPDIVRELQSGDRVWYRFYGSLNESQRRSLLGGKKLLLRELTQEQQKILVSQIYGQRYGLEFHPKDTRDSDEWQTFHSGIKGEPTERWPNGIPSSAFLTMEESNDQVVFASGSRNAGGRSYPFSEELDAGQFGFQLASIEVPGIYGDDYEAPTYSKFRFASRRKIKCTLWLDEEVSMTSDLNEKKFFGSEAMTFDQFPPDLKAAIIKEKDRIVTEHKKNKNPPRRTCN